jgi:hypothetical protein
MLHLYDWNYNNNIIDVKFKQTGTGNRFGYDVWDGGGEKILEYSRSFVGINQTKHSPVPKGGRYMIYCDAPVKKNTDTFGMIWDELIAAGAKNKWYQNNQCVNADALKYNSRGVSDHTR